MAKKLEEMTVREVLMTDEFVKTLGEVIEHEKKIHKESKEKCLIEGKPILRDVVDILEEKRVFNVDDTKILLLAPQIDGYSKIEKEYLFLVGRTAYVATCYKLLRNTDG